MNILRNEIRTGLLVVLSLAALVAVLLYLGSPGVFVPQNTYRIFYDNASGLKPGGQVLLGGRKIGRVRSLFSPVPEKDRPSPKMETLVEVQVARDARIYNKVKVLLTQASLLSEMVIDFTSGEEASGLAQDGARFLGERPPGLAEAVPAVLEKIDPAMQKITETLDTLQGTAKNLNALTAEGADLSVAFGEFRKFGTNLNEISGPGGSLRNAFANIEALTGEDGKIQQTIGNVQQIVAAESPLAKALRNAEKFTADLAENRDLNLTFRNFRQASDNLTRAVDRLGTEFSEVGRNLEEASDTVKRQPWRLIWPTTKKYPDESPAPRLTVPKAKKAPARR